MLRNTISYMIISVIIILLDNIGATHKYTNSYKYHNYHHHHVHYASIRIPFTLGTNLSKMRVVLIRRKGDCCVGIE